MKKSKFIIVVIAILTAVFVFSACDAPILGSLIGAEEPTDDGKWHKVRVADDALYSDNGYIDYAKEVRFDTERFPELADQGIYWVSFDDKGKPTFVRADTEEGAALVDPSKPTILNIHGICDLSGLGREKYFINGDIGKKEEFNLTTEDFNMNYLFHQRGYNVACYWYNRFAYEIMPATVESKIWGVPKEGIRYTKDDDSYVDDCTEYSIAEHFAAEYLRAMSYLPEDMGKAGIHVLAHSMGGEVAASGLFLLTELADAQVLPHTQLPNRYTMLDTYFAITIYGDEGEVSLYMGSPADLKIRWSGKKIVRGNSGYTTMEALKDLEANGMVLEYYTQTMSFLYGGIPEDIRTDLQAISTMTMLCPDYKGYTRDYDQAVNGHNAVREWYMCSIAFDAPVCKTEGYTIAPSASMPIETVRALKGNFFTITDGIPTLNSGDDKFIAEFRATESKNK